jgi:ABC-2 type transport system ATP-binding protein
VAGDRIAVDARDVRKSYRRAGSAPVDVLRAASVRVESGETVGLVGRNGAGKTTLLMCLAGLLSCDATSIAISGFAPRSEEARRRLGFVPERLSGNGSMAVAEFLAYLGALSGLRREQLRGRVETLLDRFELRPHRDRPLRTLSRGIQQRVGLAQALLHEPAVLLLDEPTSALDPPAIDLFHAILREEQARGTSVLLSSHQLADVREYCNRTYMLADGRTEEVRGSVTPATFGGLA